MIESMNGPMRDGEEREARLNEVLLDYVETIERGGFRDPAELLAAHPDLADDLSTFFAGRRLMERMASPSLFAAALPERSATDPSLGDEGGGHVGVPSGPAERGELGRIGDFRLVREVGRGGMGVVYEAEQISLRRRVALKVLPFAATFDSRQLQRFRNEAQAAAQLHHTAVVPIYAVGVESGVHYYAMQFIDGQSLAELIEGLRRINREIDAKNGRDVPDVAESLAPSELSQTIDYPAARRFEYRSASGPTSTVAAATLSVISREQHSRSRRYFERIAGLGVQAAEGLEHAHQVGVVHRDVKPANLLLDARGDLWVTDFGLALFRSDPGPTITGELVGTIRFMSPEQAMGTKGLVDHRTDVYSLGITLYEMLTLNPAFEGRDRHELLRQIAQQEPRPPRTVDRSIPIELETIVLKAIAKEPAERYATARELADDLRRFIDDRPIQARRPTLAEIAARWVRRHRVIAFATVATLALAVIGLSVFVSILSHEHSETKLALQGQRAKTREADEQRAMAEANFLSARSAVDFFVELSEEELLDFPPMMDVRRRLLEASVAYYQELNGKRPGDPSLQHELAMSQNRLRQLIEDQADMHTWDVCLLLIDASVQKEIDLTPEQNRKLEGEIKPLVERHLRRGADAPESRRGGLWRRLAETTRAVQRMLEETLSPRQAHRLEQIALQYPGPHAFTKPETIRRLGLTEAQQGRIREIQVEAGRKILDLFEPADDRQEAWRRKVEVWRRANQEIIALFTLAQQAKWREMIGPPFRSVLDLPPLPPAEPR